MTASSLSAGMLSFTRTRPRASTQVQLRVEPALGLVMALCAGRDGMGVVTEAVAVPIADYGALGVEDFMEAYQPVGAHHAHVIRAVGRFVVAIELARPGRVAEGPGAVA